MTRAPVHATEPFDGSHPNALAIYCSDGRFTGAVEELLRALGHPRIDTVTLPGGPGLFNAWLAGMSESSTIASGTRFLVESHRIERVVLLAHEGCGFYRKHYRGISPEQTRANQLDDLRRATQWMRDACPRVDVLAYWACVVDGRVRFEPAG